MTLYPALNCRDRVPALLDRLRLGHGGVRVEGTPRRLAVIVQQLAGRQSSAAERLRGPPAKVRGGGPVTWHSVSVGTACLLC